MILESFVGNLTESEKEVLKSHLEANPADQKIVEEYQKLWEQLGNTHLPDPINVEAALAKTKHRIIFKRLNWLDFLQRAAAVLLLALMLSSTYLYFFAPSLKTTEGNQVVIEQEISSMYGTRSKFQLPDGTKVYLNSGSKLVFPIVFAGDCRRVTLTGEAFFEVTPNTKQPFIVATRGIDVKVLGTAFDLQSYSGSNEISTTLVHGKVQLEKVSGGVSSLLTELKPSERAVFNIQEKTVKVSVEEDLDKFIGWKDGKLVFYNDPIEEVAEKLGNWYNVKVKICNNDFKRYRFTATFSDEPIEQVLSLLCSSSPIKYRINKAVKQSDNSYSKREIIFN